MSAHAIANPQVPLDLTQPTREIQQSMLRHLILIAATAYAVWFVVMTETRFNLFVLTVLLLSPVVIATCGMAMWLSRRTLVGAQVLWQVGFALAIVLAMLVTQQPAVGLLLAILPLMAMLTCGLLGGILSELSVAALVWTLGHWAGAPVLPTDYVLTIMLGGALIAALGWVATSALLSSMHWTLIYSERSRLELEKLQSQRMEYEQTQEDLIHANRELARLSDRLKTLQQLADEARLAKETFVANVSHELRTPLNMIIGFSEIITQSPQVYAQALPPALLADITAIQRNSQHLARLVDDVLDLSQIDGGRMALTKELVSVQEITESAIATVQGLFVSKGLYLDADAPDDLPIMFCDAVRIRQVLINLLSNAGRFTERGGVKVTARHQGREILISVADTGPGIPSEAHERVFEPFHQQDSSIRRRHGGSGLGLSISRRFVEMHGGKMWLESEVGVGTIFHFTLPLPATDEPSLGPEYRRWFNPYSPYTERTRSWKMPRVTVLPRFVILEEEGALKRLFERYVADSEIVWVKDVKSALTELNHSPAQALIVNAPAPHAAASATDILRAAPLPTPVLTCWLPGPAEAARQLGVQRYLIKPVGGQLLLQTLAELGGIRRVLLVDDDQEVLRLFSRVLASAGTQYEVYRAKSGEHALALLRQRRPDVMLLDLVMPGMDGFRVMREKLADAAIKDIPVVVMSATDPIGEAIISDAFTVTSNSGVTVPNLFACIKAVTDILAPIGQVADPGLRGNPSA